MKPEKPPLNFGRAHALAVLENRIAGDSITIARCTLAALLRIEEAVIDLAPKSAPSAAAPAVSERVPRKPGAPKKAKV